jgi:DNA-binding CsgD family transcriptional regulator
VAGDVETLLAEAQAAAMEGRWEAARDGFAAAVDRAGPPAELGLAEALMWLGDTDGAVAHARRSYAGFRRASDDMGAGEAAILLYFLHRESLGNVAAACGWMARLERLVDEGGAEPLRGWAVLLRSHDLGGRGDALGGAALAERAAAAARASGDADLELCALAARGALLVQAGRLAEGLELLDEAMAATLAGEGTRPDTLVFASCCTIVSCSRAAQFARAAQWIRASEATMERDGSFHVRTTCRLHLGSVRFGTGRWAEAEAELTEAIRLARTAEPAMFAEALARLAELRLAQGRVDEAAALLEGVEDRPTSGAALAGVLLARGDPDAAAAVLRRRLRAVGDGRLEAAILVELLAEAEVARGGVGSAGRRARALARLAEEVGCDVVTARAERALGRVAAAAGRPAAAAHLERALEAFCRLEMPLEAGRTHLLLADALAADAPEDAVREARAAVAAFDALGAARLADAARARLRALGVRAGPSGPRSLALLTRRELEVMALLADGLSNRDIAERLYLTRKTVEHHVHNVLVKLDLRNRAEAAAYAARHGAADPATT